MTQTDNPWLDGNQFVIRLSEGAAVYTWRLWFGDGGDVRIDVDERSTGGARSSELVVVAGAALLSRGETPPDGHEIDAVDGPGLMLKLALELLGRALPAGPAAVAARAEVAHDEPVEALALMTLSASARFPAPWRIRGDVRRAPDAALDFALVFTTGVGADHEAVLQLSGTWRKVTPAPMLDDAMSLEGWRVASLEPRVIDQQLDYGTRPVHGPATTLGELRATLADDAGTLS